MTRTDRRRLLQRLAFSESPHLSWDKDPTNTMAYDNVVGKRPTTKQRTAPWEMSTKSTCVRKKIPLSPQVHTADIPQDLRAHMDKSAFLANI